MIKALASVLQDRGPTNELETEPPELRENHPRKTSGLHQEPYFEKRSAMVLLFPRVETMDISLAVTLTDCDAHCERLKGTKDAISITAVDPQEQAGRLAATKGEAGWST